MRKSLVMIALVVLLPSLATAQEIWPRAEVLGGYSYFRTLDTRFSDVPILSSTNLNGWNASVAGNLTPWLGVVGDFSGYYGSPSIAGFFQVPIIDNSQYLFLFGPKLSYRAGDKVTPFAHFLIGDARSSTGAFGFGLRENALAAALGGGVDLGLSRSIAIRAIQADYLMTRFGDERQNNLRLSFGLVFRLGNK